MVLTTRFRKIIHYFLWDFPKIKENNTDAAPAKTAHNDTINTLMTILLPSFQTHFSYYIILQTICLRQYSFEDEI